MYINQKTYEVRNLKQMDIGVFTWDRTGNCSYESCIGTIYVIWGDLTTSAFENEYLNENIVTLNVSVPFLKSPLTPKILLL